ncbi:vascular cell adhesion protein 1 [Protobothrops mucrosquamatus]|uniref:vascular cell adhesion protein 1 n=1 Tax=Protobothrops mucrosquamatus TaxID=103944 RepID=UPI0010FB3F4B|nr:vascular cell adhesion protein 1 [Protobothrops mucrosquamatus]
MAPVTPALLSLLLTFTTVKAFGIEDIVPGHKVVAQIGHKIALSCHTTGCESPHFSWRTQLDYPLGGKSHSQGNSSVLTIQSVGFQHEHQYVCTAGCKPGEPSKEKAVMVDIYSFPSDPVIELTRPLILGEPASVTCSVPKVYPSEQLKITLLKGKIPDEKEFFQDPHTKSLQTKNHKINFIPMEEDFGKEIICKAELQLEEMALKPRLSTHVMEINYGPRNTQIVALQGNTILEGEALTLTCLTESHPKASFAWKKQLPDGIAQNITEKYNLFIPNPQASDSGTYICEVTNEVTNVVERKSLYISVQAKAFGIEDIVPGHKVVAQIGHKIALSCHTTGCESPHFSWRTQLDYPLGGKSHSQGNSSVLTIQSVGFQHEHQYVCTAGCKPGEPSKEKAVMVDIYSFPSDPVIELTSPLILGEPASVTCSVPKVYPSEQLKITLLKGKIPAEKEFFQDPHTKSLQTKNHKINFIPMEEDFGKEIICKAELLLEEMALKPRLSTHVMEINYGPRNTQIVALQGNTILEGEALTLTCLTESHPKASFAWKKQLPDGIAQNITEKYNLFIPNPQASDSGTYICEVTNEVTSVVERRSLYISVQAFSTAASTLTTSSETTTLTTSSETTTLTIPSETTTLTTSSETTTLTTPSETTTSFTSDVASETTKSVTSHATLKTFMSTTSEIAAPELITMSTSHTAPKIISLVTLLATLKNNTVVYPVDVSDDDRNNTEEIIIIARVEELDYVTPVIIVVSCLATVAGPAAAIFIYIFRKMKINGSYSLADSLKPNI